MIYKTGDKVRFLNDVGGGTISKIINQNMVLVADRDGFEIPVPVSEIVIVGQEFYRELNEAKTVKAVVSDEIQSTSEPEPLPVNIAGEDYELLLALMPENSSNIADSDLDLYFINDSSFYCMYIISNQTNSGNLQLLDKCDLEPESKKFVTTFSKSEVNAGIRLNITCFLYKHIEYKPYPPEQANIVLNPVKFFKNSFIENDFFDENAYILKFASNKIIAPELNIDPKELEKAIKQKKDKKPIVPILKQNAEIEEIDLHIEQLIDSVQGLDNGQMLEIQIARFTTALDLGISANTKKMVFIHGVGNGKLKHEIRRLLDTQYYGKVRYQDASFSKYGYGATMVIIK